MTLAPDATEFVFALGAGDRLVAVGPGSDYPHQATALARVNPRDVEAIVALAPDLVVATTAGNDPAVVKRLELLGVHTHTLDVVSLDGLSGACRSLARAVGRPHEGERLAAQIEAEIAADAASAAQLQQKTALYVVWWDPLIVAGRGSFHDDLLSRAHLTNLAPSGAGRYPRLDPETLLDPRLETVVAADEPQLRQGLARVRADAAGAQLDRTVRVIWLPADPASRPGPRLPVALAALVAARRAAP